MSLLMSQETWRLAGREPRLDRSASVSVRPCNGNANAQCYFLSAEETLQCESHRFAVRDGGEAGLGGAVPVLAADVGALAGDGGAARRLEAAAGGAKVALTDAQQRAQTRDVLGQSQPGTTEEETLSH